MAVLSQLKLKLQGRAPAAPAPLRPGQRPERDGTATRRRLVGSAMLLLLGVIVLPLLFEGQPRPLPGTAPMQQLPERELVGEMALPPAARMVGRQAEELPGPPMELPAAAPLQPPSPAPRVVPAPAAAPRPAAPPNPAPAPAVGAVAAEAVRPSASAAAPQRYIVQVGVYSEDAEVRSVRMQVEKLGLKTYVQVAGSEGARKVRVRLGPFSSKAEADRAASRIKASGLSSSVLAL